MGISVIPGLFLARHRPQGGQAMRGLTLGRQKLHMNGQKLTRFINAAKSLGLSLTPEQITQKDGYTEQLLKTLGYPDLEAMDFTDHERAAHIHDLNLPVPAELHEQFDIVLDGGTTEHVFHIGQALDNCHALLKPGGLFLSYVAADGWFGHGFFQTGPDIPWRYWHHARGYEMLEVSLINRKTPLAPITIEDPTGKPRGGERFLTGPHMILTAARKPMNAVVYKLPVQSHYVAAATKQEAAVAKAEPVAVTPVAKPAPVKKPAPAKAAEPAKKPAAAKTAQPKKTAAKVPATPAKKSTARKKAGA